MKSKRWIVICCLGMILSTMLSMTAYAQAQGVGNFLNGFWTLSAIGSSSTVLLNPTGKDRDAVVLFYDDDERFLACDVRRLSPHDLEAVRFPIPLRDFCTIFPDTCGGRLIAGAAGHLEIRSEPVDNSGTPGINGYTLPGGTAGLLSSPANLFVLDAGLFQIESKNASRVSQCACGRLKDLNSPLYTIFCSQ